jgi:hypothetical protein
LGAVEAMDLVQKQNGSLAKLFKVLSRFAQDVPNILDACRNGIQGFEAALRVMGDDMREGGLSRAGRPVKDERRKSIRQQHSPQQFARPEEMFLADVLVERARAHACGQRTGGCAVLFPHAGEQVHSALGMCVSSEEREDSSTMKQKNRDFNPGWNAEGAYKRWRVIN